jgi:hypothetical protein
MKAFNRTLFTVFILLPCLILGYQNCSELSSKDMMTNPNGSVDSSSRAPKEAPVFLNDLSLLGYTQPSDCSADTIDPMTLYSADKNICTEAKDSCEAYYLIKQNYLEDQGGNCDKVAHPDDEDFRASLKTAEASTSGFKAKPGQMCTMQFAEMINFNSRLCAKASNGCQISYFASQGYVQDKFNICR